MARGGYRPGAGRPPKDRSEPGEAAETPANAGPPESKSPLEYMLAVMNDPGVEEARRDRMAIAAAPFVHARAGEVGKKESKADAAKRVTESGRFVPTEPPRAVVVN